MVDQGRDGCFKGIKGTLPTLKHRVLQELLSKKEFPADVEGSRRLIEEHTQLKKKVGKPDGPNSLIQIQ